MKQSRSAIALFLLPASIGITVFFVAPMVFLIYTSLTNWSGGTLTGMQFVGFANFTRLVHDSEFWRAFLNTILWVAAAILIQIPVSILAALILARHPPGWRIFRTVYFFPNVIARFAIAWMWYFVFKTDIGLLNSLLRAIGLNSLALNWLGSAQTALWALIATWVFNVGFFMIIFLSQIGTIPSELYEAAEIDGAGEIRKDLHITLPMLRDTIAVSILLSVTFTFRTFELPFMLTGGGPGTSTQILPLLMYKRFIDGQNGIANAVGIMMVILGITSTVLIRRLIRERRASLA